MQDLKNLNSKKKPDFELSLGAKKKVLQLDAYYKQGMKWYKVISIRKQKGK